MSSPLFLVHKSWFIKLVTHSL